jgi:hypothetical protein
MPIAEDLRYDPLSPPMLAAPYGVYRHLRDNEPLHVHTEPPFYALSRFADVWVAVRNHEVYSSAEGLTFWGNEIDRLGLAPTMVMMDPPRQVQLRRLISKGFTPNRVTDLEPSIRAFVRARLALIDELVAAGEPVDLHQDFSNPIPSFVLATLLDIPESDRAMFDPWVLALTTLQNSGFDLNGLTASGAVTEMFAYLSDAIEQRKARPGDDLISALVHAEVDGERLSDWDILGFLFVIVAGGNDTTANLISGGVALLTDAPGQRAVLAADPTLIPAALDEFLRLESPVQGLARTTTRDVEHHGVVVPAGSKVMLLYGAANRDEREYGPSVDELDVRRGQRHLAFGNGVHFCIGSHLAKLQARVAFEELLARHPGIGVDASAGERTVSAFVRGWHRLPAHDLSR